MDTVVKVGIKQLFLAGCLDAALKSNKPEDFLHKNQDNINVLSKAVSHIKMWLNI